MLGGIFGLSLSDRSPFGGIEFGLEERHLACSESVEGSTAGGGWTVWWKGRGLEDGGGNKLL